MDLKEKKKQALRLYTKGGITQKELAELFGVSSKTISNWALADNWESHRKRLLVTREEQLSHLYNQLSELNNKISEREEGERYSSSKEGDTIAKLTSAIRNLEIETSIAEYVTAFQKLVDYIRMRDLELAQKVTLLADDFIKTLIK